MRRNTRWAGVVPAVLAIVALAAAGGGSTRAGFMTCLDVLHGTWRGRGTLMGRSIVMQQRWEPAVGGAFTELRMQHFISDTSSTPVFEGRGFYRFVGPRAADSVHGTWFDGRGLTLVIRGACENQGFSSQWTGAERGRTIYQRRGSELLVIDSIFPATGPGREFGRHTLERQEGTPGQGRGAER